MREGTRAPSILLIEDDGSLRAAVTAALLGAGYNVTAVPDGSEVTRQPALDSIDLAIVDVRLPIGPDGFALAESIRQRSTTAVVFVTAADSLEERLRGFELGADDYLVKPFAMPELVARVHAVLRRAGRLPASKLRVGDLMLDETDRRAARRGIDLELTRIEFDLLRTFAADPGRVFSKHELLVLVWGFAGHRPNLVEVHVSALRRKLEEHGPRMLFTEHSRGYVLRA